MNPIIYVEDDQNDTYLMHMAFDRAEAGCPLVVLGDGRKAMDYLRGVGAYSDRNEHPLPCLLLLDLKLPIVGGFEVLQWMRSQPALRSLPVLVFSSSARAEDVERAYKLGANAFLVKPANVTDLVAVAAAIKEFWLVRAKLPRECCPPPPPVKETPLKTER